MTITDLWTPFDLKVALSLEDLPIFQNNCNNCSIDSRNVKKGDLFIGLKGKNFNGNDFWLEALKKEASCVILDEDFFQNTEIPSQWRNYIISVKNTYDALEELAIYARNRTSAFIIGVTGSVGKTTTKEILYHSLKELGAKVYASKESFNNHIGLPLSLIRLPINAEIGVFELGMNTPGEIIKLASILMPNLSIVTKIAPVHIAQFDYLYKILIEKCSIFNKTMDLCVLNTDVYIPNYYSDIDINLSKLELQLTITNNKKERNFNEKFLKNDINNVFSELETCIKYCMKRKKIYAFNHSNLSMINKGSDILIIVNKFFEKDIIFSIKLDQMNLLENFALTASVLYYLEQKKIVKNIENSLHRVFLSFKKIEGRGSIYLVDKILHNGKRINFTLLDESYNANLLSMKNAIKNLKDNHQNYRKIIVLGDMKELGVHVLATHAEILIYTYEIFTLSHEDFSKNKLFCIGNCFENALKFLKNKKSNMSSFLDTVEHFDNVIDLLKAIENFIQNNDVIMLKGSNSMNLRYIAQQLTINSDDQQS